MTSHFIADTVILQGRSMRHVTRSLDTIITVAVTPIMLMLLFVSVFGRHPRPGPAATSTICCPASC